LKRNNLLILPSKFLQAIVLQAIAENFPYVAVAAEVWKQSAMASFLGGRQLNTNK
jgi:hypothetical protein